MTTPLITERVRKIIGDHARLSVDVQSIGDFDDLYQAGMTSHASVALMLAIENEFNVELPYQMLSRATFESISSIANALSTLQQSEL